MIGFTVDNRLILVRQYRPSIDSYTIELPGGIDLGFTPLHSAKSELVEETGLDSNH